jgi:6,7-dimethyl-8-ribityllumazine synthase
MTDRDRSGTYNPFEDTGDWPFRESAAPPARPPGKEPDDRPVVFDGEAHEERPEEGEPDQPLLPVEERDDTVFRLEPEPQPLVDEPEPELEPERALEAEPEPELEPEPQAATVEVEDEPAEPVSEPLPLPEPEPEEEPPPAAEEAKPAAEPEPEPEPGAAPDQHAPGDLRLPDGSEVLEGSPNGFRRTVAVVVSRFNADVTNRLLDTAIDTLVDAHVSRDAITIVPVPGAFELPLAAMALAKTRRFSCVIALGCVIRGETPHFDFVAGEAASGLQLAAIETGVPVSFGLLTCETKAQAEARVGRGADAALAALEMADLFTQVRTRATRPA